MVHIYNRILAIKKNTFESLLVRWMNLELIITEQSKSEREKYHILMHIYGIWKNGTDVSTCRAGIAM